MEKFNLFNVIIVVMFIFGLAFSIFYRISNQEIPIANSTIEVSPQQENLVDPVS
ncbi:MAG: hypothetical protein OEQ24_10990 [Gammaproteobacteria bacterium]|nr:hypothetical protein [Gammaproteobacteria bacterium]